MPVLRPHSVLPVPQVGGQGIGDSVDGSSVRPPSVSSPQAAASGSQSSASDLLVSYFRHSHDLADTVAFFVPGRLAYIQICPRASWLWSPSFRAGLLVSVDILIRSISLCVYWSISYVYVSIQAFMSVCVYMFLHVYVFCFLVGISICR